MNVRPLIVAAGLVAACCTTLSSSDAAGNETSESSASLTVGSMAPRISVDRWLKGAPVYTYERGRVYVVEFWSTWCTPCIASIPHLTELQKKYPNITIIGVTASEQPTRANLDDRLSKAESFVAKQGTRMDYTVAYDGNGFMWSNWMVPAQRGGIPSTFIVGPEGRIEWIGHPQMDEFDRALDATVNQPGVRTDPSNWKTIAAKPSNVSIPAPTVKRPAPATKVTSSQPTKLAPASTRIPPKPAPAPKKIASGPVADDSSTPR